MIEKKLYSDPRWWDDPKPRSSLCGTCKYDLGFLKCVKHGEIPIGLLRKSFPGCEGFDENYCQYREEKTEEES